MSRIIMRMNAASSTMRMRLAMSYSSVDLLDFLDSIPLAYDIGHADTEVFVDHHDLAFGDQLVVNQDVDRLAGQLVQFDNGTLGQFQNVLNLLLGSAKFNRNLKRNIQQEVQVRLVRLRQTGALKAGELYGVDVD